MTSVVPRAPKQGSVWLNDRTGDVVYVFNLSNCPHTGQRNVLYCTKQPDDGLLWHKPLREWESGFTYLNDERAD